MSAIPRSGGIAALGLGGTGGSGSGTVTVVSSGSLTSTALVTGGGSQTLQTPSATSTLDASGNLTLAGALTSAGATLSANLVFTDTGEGLSLHGGSLITSSSGVVTIVAGATRVTLAGTTPASVGTGTGTSAGFQFSVTGVFGGSTSIATTGTGGLGGGISLTAGTGGSASSAVTSSTGGAGGDFTITSGAGAGASVAGSGTNTGGAGGGFTLQGSAGGAAGTGTGVNTGGASGPVVLKSGNGGAATSGSSNTGGASGPISISTGNGGAGSTAAGNSGSLTIDTGTSGAGGTVGSVILKSGGVTVITLTNTPLATFAGSASVTTSITTPSTTFALVNTVATTVNFAAAASTALNIGHASGATSMLGIIAFNGATASSSTSAIFPASTTSVSSLRIPHGTAPTSPVNGDIWTTTSGLVARINGASVTFSTGTGDFVGPGSATDNAVVRFDGTTGKLGQNSAVTIDDSNNISTAGAISTGVGGSAAGGIEMTQGTAPTAGTTSIKLFAPAAVTSYMIKLPGATGTGIWLGTDSSGTESITRLTTSGSGTVVALATAAALTSATITTSLVPTSNDGAALGSTANQFSDLFLAEGGVINWDNGDCTLTQAGNVVTFAGAELVIDAALHTSTVAAGFRGIPQNSQSAAYTTVLADSGKHILHPTADNNARTFTIDSNANVAYPIGTVLVFVNQINTVTIAITSDTMTLQPGGTTGSRTLAANNSAAATKVAATAWVISGTSGLT